MGAKWLRRIVPQSWHFYLKRIDRASTGLANLIGLNNLAELYLNNTSVTDQGLVHLNKLPRLRTLSINNTMISKTGLIRLKDHPQLVYVQAVNAAVTEDDVRVLETTMPGCKIERRSGFWSVPGPEYRSY